MISCARRDHRYCYACFTPGALGQCCRDVYAIIRFDTTYAGMLHERHARMRTSVRFAYAATSALARR